MLDVLHLQDTQSYDFKQYFGLGLDIGTTNLDDWVIWTKPRGIKFCYMLGVGGGGSGGGSSTTAGGNLVGGGGGGGSGAQTSILLPEMFIPDVLYIYAGAGGKGQIDSSGAGINGANTYIAIERYSTFTPNLTLLRANGGSGGGGGVETVSTLAPGGVGGAASTIADMPLCRGSFTSLAGQTGGTGGDPNQGAGGDITFPTTGLMVTGGAGGGGSGTGAAGGDGGNINAPITTLGDTYFAPVFGGSAVAGVRRGGSGYSSSNYIINVGGAGGRGAGTGTGNEAGQGGDAAPGSGGGGTGGSNNSNKTNKGGEGGPGFVIILCW